MEYNVCVIDRSNPHDVICWVPEDTARKNNIPAGNRTLLQELQRTGRPGRTDIALVNEVHPPAQCPTCGKQGYIEHGQQYTVYPTTSGEPQGDGWGFLSKEQQHECRRINQAILEVGKQYPEMLLLLDRIF